MSARSRKTACEMCRTHKRRCDGLLPSCSRCHKAQFPCVYTIQSPHSLGSSYMSPSVPTPQTDTSTYMSTNYQIGQDLASDMDPSQLSIDLLSPVTSLPRKQHTFEFMQQFPAQVDMPLPFDLDTSTFEAPPGGAFSATQNWQQYLPTPSIATTLPSGLDHPQLPCQEQVLKMVTSFFSAQHQLLPTIHRKSFMARLSNNMIDLGSGPLLWVILALYCSCNKSESMQMQYQRWMQTAHSKLELMSTTCVRSNTTNMLQASIWMVFDAYCRGDITNAWLLLGRTAQLTSALGLDRIDSKCQTPRMESELQSRSDIEVEERRKCMWCLALLDRVIVSVNGLALSVDDRYFHIDFPLPDEEFQEAEYSIMDIEYLREKYSSEAFDLLNGNATSTMVTKPSFEHVLKISVILGHALAIQNSVRHEASTHKQCLERLRTLESVLNTFCYAASASSEGISQMALMQLWLKMLTQCSKVLMLHPPGPSVLGLCNCLNSSLPGVSPTRTETECVRAAFMAATTFSHALNKTNFALNNPFLLPMACTSVRMLILLRNQMHVSDHERIRGLIGEMLRVVDHIGIKFPGVAAKARETIMQRVNELEHGTRMSSLGCYIGLDCE